MTKPALSPLGGGSAGGASQERSKAFQNNPPAPAAQRPPNPNTASPHAELVAYLRDALAEVAETDGVVVGDVVATVIDRAISALRSDDSLPERTRLRWEAFFYDAADRAVSDLRRLRGLIRHQQAICAVEDFFFDHALTAPEKD